MKPNDIIFTPKLKHFLKDDTRFMLLGGPTGTGKTFSAGIKTFFRIMTSGKGRDTYALVAESISTAEKMFVDDAASFVNIFPNCRYVGGSKPHIRVETVTGPKLIYLGGFGNKGSWRKILGLNLHGIHIEEGTIAHDDFLREAFVRANRLVTNPWLLATTNGGVPEQVLYTEFFDKGYYDKEVNTNIPEVERIALKEIDKNFKYYYWGFEDSATLEQEQIDNLYNLFPVGSFFYNSKILGVRGYSTGMLYASLITTDHMVAFHNLDLSRIVEVVIGCDIGDSAKTVFTMSGLSFGSQRVIVIDTLDVSTEGNKDYTDIINEFNVWLTEWYKVFFTTIKQVRVDKSSPLFVKQLRNNIGHNIAVISSASDKIINRVSNKQQLIKQDRLIWTNLEGSKTSAKMLKQVKDDGKGGHIDLNTPDIDYSDSLDYSIEPFITRLSVHQFRR